MKRPKWSTPNGHDTAAWRAFAARQAGHPFLGLNPLYALPVKLIDAVRKYVPGFFRPEEERLERDLAATARFGFFNGRALGESADEIQEKGGRTRRQRVQAKQDQIRARMTEEFRKRGATEYEIGEYFRSFAEQEGQIAARQDAYLGWLLLNPEFHRELSDFRWDWEAVAPKIGHFPRLQMKLLSKQADATPWPDGFQEACRAFYVRWNLETLVTWDWPLPMEPDLDTHLRANPEVLSEGGMVLFVPWCLLRGEKLDFRAVIDRARLATRPDHLADWVHRRGKGRRKSWDDVRYGLALQVYRWYQLVLMPRYPHACRRNRERLDEALATVFGTNRESVKKVRHEVQRSLKAIRDELGD